MSCLNCSNYTIHRPLGEFCTYLRVILGGYANGNWDKYCGHYEKGDNNELKEEDDNDL